MLRRLALTTALAAAALAGCSHDETQAKLDPPGQDEAVGFHYLDEGDSAKLAYGQAHSDNVGLMLECAKGSHVVQVTDLVRSSPAPILTLISGGGRADLAATVEAGEGPAIATASLRSDAPTLTGFRHTGAMEVAYAGLRYRMAAAPAERDGIDQFFTACGSRRRTGSDQL